MSALTPLAWTGLIIATGIVVINPLTKLFGKGSSQDDIVGLKEVTKKPAKDGSKTASISDVQAKSYADQMYSLMSGWGRMDTRNDAYNKLTMLTRDLNGKDLQKVFQQFGLRKYADFNQGAPGPITSVVGKIEDIDLFGWFRKEITTGADIDYMWNAYWYKTGLTPFAQWWPTHPFKY